MSSESTRTFGRREARRRAEELLDRVRVPEPARRMKQYPHEFSGEWRNVPCSRWHWPASPDSSYSTSPRPASDVTIQADILDLIADLERLHAE
jgi:peptide/nickel transport system ATP-binding protein